MGGGLIISEGTSVGAAGAALWGCDRTLTRLLGAAGAALAPSRLLTERTLTAFVAQRAPGGCVPGDSDIWQVTWMLTAVYLSLVALLCARAGAATTFRLLVRLNLLAAALVLSRETVTDHLRRIRGKYAAAGREAPTKIDLHWRAVEDGLI